MTSATNESLDKTLPKIDRTKRIEMLSQSVMTAIHALGHRIEEDATLACEDAGVSLVNVGVLCSLTGQMAVNERGVAAAILMAIMEINEKSDTRRIVPFIEDGNSADGVFASATKNLLKNDVQAIFGCWVSSARKKVISLLHNSEKGPLLVYPAQYEGLAQSSSAIYMGAIPNQQVYPTIKWMREKLLGGEKLRCFIFGSDYIYPRASIAQVKLRLQEKKNTFRHEVFYVPLNRTNHGGRDVFFLEDLFSEILPNILADSERYPNLILNFINGDKNNRFLRLLKQSSLKEVPTLSFSLTPPQVKQFFSDDPISFQNDYIATTYVEKTGEGSFACAFNRFAKNYLNCTQAWVTSDAMWNAYLSVHLWWEAVRISDSTEREDVREALKSDELNHFLPTKFRQTSQLTAETFPRFGNGKWHAYHSPVLLRLSSNDGSISCDQDEDFPPIPQIHPEPFPVGSLPKHWENYAKRLWFASDELPQTDFPYREEMREIQLAALSTPQGADWISCVDNKDNHAAISQFYTRATSDPHAIEDWANLGDYVKEKSLEMGIDFAPGVDLDAVRKLAASLQCGDQDFRNAVQLGEQMDQKQFGIAVAKLLAWSSRVIRPEIYLFDMLDYLSSRYGQTHPVVIDGNAYEGIDQLEPYICKSLNFGYIESQDEVKDLFRVIERMQTAIKSITHSVSQSEKLVRYICEIEVVKHEATADFIRVLKESTLKRAGNVSSAVMFMRRLFGDLLENGSTELRHAVTASNWIENLDFGGDGGRLLLGNKNSRAESESELVLVGVRQWKKSGVSR
ncbi:MAG: transporter substrate-binding protein [Planctomycetota bacterium]